MFGTEMSAFAGLKCVFETILSSAKLVGTETFEDTITSTISVVDF